MIDIEQIKNYQDLVGFMISGDTTMPDLSGYPEFSFNGKRNYIIVQIDQSLSISALGIHLDSDNNTDNYILFDNLTSNDITISFRSLKFNGSSVNNVRIPEDAIIVSAGKALELSYVANENYGIVSVGSSMKCTL